MAIRKINSDEPWRFCCPECGSVAVEKLTRTGFKVPGRTYTSGGVGNIEAKEDMNRKYRCEVCYSKLQKVYDKKREVLVRNP